MKPKILLRRLSRVFKLIAWTTYSVLISVFYVTQKGWNGIRNGSILTKKWCKGIAEIIDLKIKIFGDPSIVKGGLIVSNHLSYLDIIVHSSVFAPRFSPKSSSAMWPIIGQIIMMNRPVWINRASKRATKKTIRQFNETMKNGLNLLVYPEGTSTDGKNALAPFKTTPFGALDGTEFPIFPVLTVYRQKNDEPTVCWFGDMTLLPHIWTISAIPEINVELHLLGKIMPEGRTRKEIANYLYKLMNEKYLKLINVNQN